MDAFLTQSEKKHIQSLYGTWTDHLQTHKFASEVYSRDLISTREKQKLDALTTVFKKNEYLFEITLQRITYDHLVKIRDVLVRTDQVEMARKLPVRPGDLFWKTYDDSKQRKAEEMLQQQQEEQKRRRQQQENPNNRSQGYSSRSESPMQTEQYHVHEAVNEQQLKSRNDQPQAMMTETYSTTVPAAWPEHPNRPIVLPKLPSYKNKACNPPKGKGYCLIIANYTNNLRGYKEDIKNITQFFRDELGYTVRTEKDLKRAKMMDVLTETRDELNNPGNNYDRLFVFVLSHGTKEGIQTCLPDGERDEVLDRWKQHIKSEDVVSLFTHDKLPCLKDFPKVFFFQICQGRDIAQAAGTDHGDTSMGDESMQADLVQSAAGAAQIAIGADTLVCYASPVGYFSWVDNNKGSWLIEVTIHVFKKHYKSDHLVDMMTQINKEITLKSQPSRVQDTIQEVYQIPCIKHNLTRKLFLHNN